MSAIFFGHTFSKPNEYIIQIPIQRDNRVVKEEDQIKICDGAYSPKLMLNDDYSQVSIHLGMDNACQSLKVDVEFEDHVGKKIWTNVYNNNGEIPGTISLGMTKDSFMATKNVKAEVTHLSTIITCSCSAKNPAKKKWSSSMNGFKIAG